MMNRNNTNYKYLELTLTLALTFCMKIAKIKKQPTDLQLIALFIM